MKVLHYKSNFLNSSETFIHRVIENHTLFEPVAMCIDERDFTENIKVYEKPQQGIHYFINSIYFHLNWTLPFYNRTIREVEPDIIHAHFGFDGYRMIKPARLGAVPLIVSFYGSDVTRLPGEFDWQRRYKKLASSAQAFIAASRHMKSQLIALGFPKSKIEIIPFGLELEKFNFDADHECPQRMMMVGRMVEKKGFEYAIEAISELKEAGSRVELDLFGDGELRAKLEEKVQTLGVQNRIHFHGYVSVERVVEEHKNHDILLAPSVTAADGDEEGLPNTILEAMASGTVVIATDHAAISEVIKDKKTGLLVEEKNVQQLANAVEFAYSPHCNRKSIRISARKLIESQFTTETVVAQIEALYQKVIQNSA